MYCQACNKNVDADAPFCPNCGESVFAATKNEKKVDPDAIIVRPENIHISKQQRGGGFSIFGDFFGGGFSVRPRRGIFDSLFGDVFGGFFEDEEEEEYCDFTPSDQKFLNPKLKIIDPKKMIIYDPDDIAK